MLISKYALGVRRDDIGGRGRLPGEQAGMRRLTMTAPAQLARAGVQVAIPNAATPVGTAGNLASSGRPQLRKFHVGRRDTATSGGWIDIIAALHTRAVT
ncbi:MAG: hypothetical protein J2P17_22210 [Mycobacterium sp.]|nr:hypothetical protein [Mycobacterium sp.]